MSHAIFRPACQTAGSRPLESCSWFLLITGSIKTKVGEWGDGTKKKKTGLKLYKTKLVLRVQAQLG